MRLGVIARSESRGLGHQTHQVVANLHPAKVLHVVPRRQRWPLHPHWYADENVTEIEWDGSPELEERIVQEWLDDLDAVYTAETFYDWRIVRWCHERSMAAVCHANPEMLSPEQRLTRKVTWWTATPWLAGRTEFTASVIGARVVPMPNPMPAPEARPVGERVKFLHVAGHAAISDRNGTRCLSRGAPYLRTPMELEVVGQDGELPQFFAQDQVTVKVNANGVDDFANLYRNADVLVMARRFGGLCLPVIEALGSGMAVLMPDVSPNEIWPGPRVPVDGMRDTTFIGGRIPLADISWETLGNTIEALAQEPELVDQYRAEAREWAAANTWERLAPLWWEALADAMPPRRPW